jgi:hypothetical protein
MNRTTPLSGIPEQAQYHARILCEIADGLRIEDCPIILNPAMPHGVSVVLGPDHWCCISGSLEVHTHPSTYNHYAIPAEFAGVTAMVKDIKSRLKTYRVVTTIRGTKFYAWPSGQADEHRSVGTFSTNSREKAEQLRDWINQRAPWEGVVTWKVEVDA